jgi:hypothetical protein
VKRRLVLHLGLWKTGTTTIQYFLRGNPGILADVGVHYPKVGPENTDHPSFRHKPPTEFLAEEVSHQFLGRELSGRKRRPAGDLPLWSTVFRQIEDSDAHTTIISYEDFSARVLFYHFDLIAERLKTFDVVGLIYLRPQESWAVSLYSHLIRGGRTSLTFGEFLDSIRQRLAYSVLLDQIRDQIPLNSLIVRNFDDAAKKGLVEDFFEGLELPSAQSTPASGYDVRNRSLPHWAVLFLLKCIQASFPAECVRDVRKALTGSAASRRAASLRPGLDLATPQERARLRAIMSADAARLEQNYGITFAERGPAALYRPFDKDDFNAIMEAIAPRLASHTRAALDDL